MLRLEVEHFLYMKKKIQNKKVKLKKMQSINNYRLYVHMLSALLQNFTLELNIFIRQYMRQR